MRHRWCLLLGEAQYTIIGINSFLAGLDLPDFSALNPAARHWLDTVANVRLHSETRTTPTALWHKKRPSLRPLPLHPFGIATVSQVRLPAVSYYPRHQPLFSPGPLCRPNP